MRSRARATTTANTMNIDRITPRGFLVAATNLDQALDPAIWRRFDEVIWFDMPDRRLIERFLRMKFRNVVTSFDPVAHAPELKGYSYAEIDRISVQAIKAAVIDKRKEVREHDFREAVADERRRKHGSARLSSSS
jgi:AAA+ superfamily predicted ATPase